MSVITGDRHLLPPTFHTVETSVLIAPETPQATAYPDYQNALHELAQAIEWSHGSFSLILAHCNSPQVRHHVLQDLTQTCALSLQSIALEPSAELMFSSILQNLQALKRSSTTHPVHSTDLLTPPRLERSGIPDGSDLAGDLADHSIDSSLAVTIADNQPPIEPNLPDLQKTLAHANAITISGFETVLNIETLLASADIIRDELRKVFHCPLVWWVNDEILVKLMRIAPNIHSWFTSVEFPNAELVNTALTTLNSLENPNRANTDPVNPDPVNPKQEADLVNIVLAGAGVGLAGVIETVLAAPVINSESSVQVEMMCEVA